MPWARRSAPRQAALARWHPALDLQLVPIEELERIHAHPLA
jgi:hypothetical protein